MTNRQMTETTPLLAVEHLKKWFPMQKNAFSRTKGFIKAVDDVSFSVDAGETLGIVGESGCGKSTMGRTILRLYNPTSGKIFFDGQDFCALNKKDLKKARNKMKLIFQDPFASLNPRMTVKDTIAEALDIQKVYATAAERDARVEEVMKMVGLDLSYMRRYPHEFSGGQRQRICIARTLALQPKLIICDEPVSALDVSIQAKIINLLKELQDTLGVTYLFISHDLSVVKHISNRVAVMYLGRIVEIADKADLYSNPSHPYTQALFSAIPRFDADVPCKEIVLSGEVPSPANPPSGCRFHTRCPMAQKICSEETPEMKEIEPHHYCACHFCSRT
jgi:oligopeptide/dipeptide ABC transporter ATP-binding protein